MKSGQVRPFGRRDAHTTRATYPCHSTAKMRIMFDTNIFNRIADGEINSEYFPRAEYFCTNLQQAEIQHTSDEHRRKFLSVKFALVNMESTSQIVKQRTTPWGSPWGSPWNSGGEYYEKIKEALEKEKPRDRGNSYDAVMIETCLYERICFISADSAAIKVAKAFNVNANSWEEFKKSAQKVGREGFNNDQS